MLGVFKRKKSTVPLYSVIYKGYLRESLSLPYLANKNNHMRDRKGAFKSVFFSTRKSPPEDTYEYLRYLGTTFLFPVEFVNNGRY